MIMRTIVFFVLLLLVGCGLGRSQGIATLHFPSYLCEGGGMLVSFGYDDTNSVVVVPPAEASLGHGDLIFLPDGEPCGTMGCSYQSAVEFTCFHEGGVISSVNDIKYLRLKMEHSYIGDLYINLTCPNGSKADILRYGGPLAGSGCTEHIPAQSVGWQTGNNIGSSSYLGIAHDNEDANALCDANAPANAPGIGFNYCWSSSTAYGYNYAPGDGIIYRSGNVHGITVDSSYVAMGQHFYHPDESFETLVGCPLNGEWYIEVQDGWTMDNGYLFEWELVLNDSLLPQVCQADRYELQGYGVTPLTDSTFFINMPANLAADTVLHYDIRIFYDCDTVVDTSIDLMVRHRTHTNHYAETPENSLPFPYQYALFDNDVEDSLFVLTDGYGCDSNVHFYLTVWRNTSQTFDTFLCGSVYPVTWHGYSFNGPDSVAVTYTDSHGADSVEVLIVRTGAEINVVNNVTICEGSSYSWVDGNSYSMPTDLPVFRVSSDEACDTVYHLHLSFPAVPIVASMGISPSQVQSGDVVTLTDLSGSVDRMWQVLNYSSTDKAFRFVFPTDLDSAEVQLTVHDRFGCTDTAVRWIFLDNHAVWLPNVFTPDEQLNNLFSVYSNDVVTGTVDIYDRRGLHVATFDMLGGSWDGRRGGVACPQGTYVWRLRYVTRAMPNVEQEERGTVLLLR